MNNQGEIFLYERAVKSSPEINIWLAFPAIRNFGLSSLGYMSIFKTLDSRSDYYVERIFTDTKSAELPLNKVDLMGFSFSFEIDFLGIFKIMETFNIPFYSKDRGEDFPLIFAGGPVVSANPEPFCEFFDFIMIGDAEGIDTRIVDFIKENKHLPKDQLLKLLSEKDGIYVPSLTEFENDTVKMNGKPLSVEKVSCSIENTITTPVLSEKSFFSNTFIIEIARGCAQRCGFCIASYLNLPVRFADYEQIISEIDRGLKYTNKIALLGALISAHPDFDKICAYIREKKKQIPDLEMSVSSLRADSISPEVVQTLVECGQKHATIAIEAGSDRLRKVINKNLTEEQIFKTVRIAQENGLKGLKIYAMIGHPTETKEDIEAMVNLAEKLKKEFKTFDFTYSFATFVPKSHTPFQYCAREDNKTLEKKYNFLKKRFHQLGIKIRLSSINWDYYQALLSRGDRRLCKYVEEVYKQGGNLGAFKNAYKKLRAKKLLPSSDEFALKAHELSEPLPWDFINVYPGKEILKNENGRLLEKPCCANKIL